jgi:hypothetical protein
LEQKNGEILYESKFGKQFYLELFLDGDLKFLLTVMGINAANSNYLLDITSSPLFNIDKDEIKKKLEIDQWY